MLVLLSKTFLIMKCECKYEIRMKRSNYSVSTEGGDCGATVVNGVQCFKQA